MRRQDAVRQAISLVKAKQTKVFNSLQLSAAESRDTPRTAYDFDAINKEYLRFLKEDRLWESFFHESGISPVVVTYEEFILDFESHMRRVLTHLGQSVPDDFRCPDTSYTRQSDSTNDAWAERFEDDRSARAKLPRSA
jgi:LPS sulfotransferase NodH